MIHDLTYQNRQANLEINRAIGKPFGALSKERWAGIGSERLIVKDAKGEIAEVFENNFSQNFTNIELRPKGILVRIRYRLEVFGVAIPFDGLQLEMMNSKTFRLIYGNESITLVHYQGRGLNVKFLQKIDRSM